MIDAMQHPMTQTIAAKFVILKPLLDERARRLWAAVEARALGRGGISQVAEATGLARATVRAGLQDSRCRPPPLAHRLLLSGYAVLEGDANHWGCVIHTSYRPWKPSLIL